MFTTSSLLNSYKIPMLLLLYRHYLFFSFQTAQNKINIELALVDATWILCSDSKVIVCINMGKIWDMDNIRTSVWDKMMAESSWLIRMPHLLGCQGSIGAGFEKRSKGKKDETDSYESYQMREIIGEPMTVINWRAWKI